jgi:hypothetical protein
MTSNVGSHLITAYRGGNDPNAYEEMKRDVLGACSSSSGRSS